MSMSEPAERKILRADDFVFGSADGAAEVRLGAAERVRRLSPWIRHSDDAIDELHADD